MRKSSSTRWVLGLIFSLLFSISMGLCLVWLSIERTDKAYTIRRLQQELSYRIAFKHKLEVERERLLAPFELVRKAHEFGMHEAKPGQIRRVPAPE